MISESSEFRSSKSRAAGQRDAGSDCAHCRTEIVLGQTLAVCEKCGAVHHAGCWDSQGGCGSYVCAPSKRAAAAKSADVMRISLHEIDIVDPLPKTRGPAPDRVLTFPVKMPPRTNRLAIAAIICAVAGIIFMGVPGLVAVLLGSLSFAPIRAHSQRGTALAIFAIFLGMFDIVGWIFFANWIFHQPSNYMPMHDLAPDPSANKDLPPALRRAMNANVVLENGLGIIGGSMGSGVILKIESGVAFIVTNRHVVDDSYSSSTRDDKVPDDKSLRVKWIDQKTQAATVVWVAPNGIDIAIVKAPCISTEAEAAVWQANAQPKVGDAVFAIGNPQGLSWTHTQGVISQFRARGVDGKEVRVIQTQTALNHGNSGGGLYDHEGNLIGINTWSTDKRVSEGLSFAISWQSILDLHPPGTELPKPKEKSK